MWRTDDKKEKREKICRETDHWKSDKKVRSVRWSITPISPTSTGDFKRLKELFRVHRSAFYDVVDLEKMTEWHHAIRKPSVNLISNNRLKMIHLGRQHFLCKYCYWAVSNPESNSFTYSWLNYFDWLNFWRRPSWSLQWLDRRRWIIQLPNHREALHQWSPDISNISLMVRYS